MDSSPPNVVAHQLHIEGEPYERGYQHGRLMANEIAAHLRCFAATLSSKAPGDDWQSTRRLVNALFLRRFVTQTPDWLHVDLYAWNPKDRPGRPIGAEAQAVRALFALLVERYR